MIKSPTKATVSAGWLILGREWSSPSSNLRRRHVQMIPGRTGCNQMIKIVSSYIYLYIYMYIIFVPQGKCGISHPNLVISLARCLSHGCLGYFCMESIASIHLVNAMQVGWSNNSKVARNPPVNLFLKDDLLVQSFQLLITVSFVLKDDLFCFPTCQVRVVRFYVSCLLLLVLLLLSSSSPRPPPPPRPPAQLRPSTPSVPCRTPTTIIPAQCSLPDHPRPVFPAGPQPRPSPPSVPCRISTTTIHAQCSLPDLNRDFQIAVGTAGPQRQECQKRCQIDCQKICQIECQKICQIKCHEICQIECQKIYQIECQKICQIECQKICQIKCHEICQIECRKICQIECQKICQIECQKICQNICQKDMPDRMPDRMPEDMSDRMPEDMPDRMPENMPEEMPEEMPEDMPDRMPEDMSEYLPERYAR